MKKSMFKNVVTIIGTFMLLICLYPHITVSAEEDVYYALSVSPDSIDYGTIGSVTLGSEKTFTVTNTGDVNETVIWHEENPAGAFMVDILSDGYLSPGESATFTVNPRQMLPEGSYYCAIEFYAEEDFSGKVLANANLFMTVDDPDVSEVTQVIVSPDYATVQAGQSCSFHADVHGNNIQDYSVNWSLSGNRSGGTTISDGFLEVAADETATNLTVTATSRQDGNVYNSVNVAVQRNEYTVNVSSSEGGTASGGGRVIHGGSVNMNASAYDGYRFSGWYEGKNCISTSNPFTLSNVTSNRNITAKFDKNTYTITTQVNDKNGGTVSDGGKVNYNGKITLKAKANKGYAFDGFYEENNKISSAETLELNGITSDRTITAVFTRSSFVVRTHVNPDKTGSVTGAGTYDKGSKVELVATPADGYIFSGWTKDGQLKSADPVYQIGSVDTDITLVANFTKKVANVYVINASAGKGGIISPLGAQNVTEGTSVTYAITSQGGYKIDKVTVDGIKVGAVSSYRFRDVKGNHEIVATFIKDEQEDIEETEKEDLEVPDNTEDVKSATDEQSVATENQEQPSKDEKETTINNNKISESNESAMQEQAGYETVEDDRFGIPIIAWIILGVILVGGIGAVCIIWIKR